MVNIGNEPYIKVWSKIRNLVSLQLNYQVYDKVNVEIWNISLIRIYDKLHDQIRVQLHTQIKQNIKL